MGIMMCIAKTCGTSDCILANKHVAPCTLHRPRPALHEHTLCADVHAFELVPNMHSQQHALNIAKH
eukprot:9191382-Alexandrium_andersonii.AAC.1